MEPLSLEEQAAASAVASLSGAKRDREDDSPDAAGGFKPGKIARALMGDNNSLIPPEPAVPLAPENINPNLKPYPFFLYNDFSTEPDPDPLTPLTPPGRVPNFPAKMHSILSRPELADIVCWMPHGRSWRVLKPREFEVRVIPTYFEHAKFSSFVRQANGWGFRRITQGRDRNSYYHELFLRGLPHLCKKMKRPGVSEKQAADPEHEPDLYKISEMHPVPEKCDDDSILLQCTLDGGPKARMPIYTGVLSRSSLDSKPPALPTFAGAQHLTPRDQEALNAFQQSLGASENQLKNLDITATMAAAPAAVTLPPSTFAVQPPPFNLAASAVDPQVATTNPLATANQLAFANPNMAAAFQATSAASQFAAGFAAATALTQQQFKQMLESFAMGLPATTPGANPGIPPPQPPP